MGLGGGSRVSVWCLGFSVLLLLLFADIFSILLFSSLLSMAWLGLVWLLTNGERMGDFTIFNDDGVLRDCAVGDYDDDYDYEDDDEL